MRKPFFKGHAYWEFYFLGFTLYIRRRKNIARYIPVSGTMVKQSNVALTKWRNRPGWVFKV